MPLSEAWVRETTAVGVAKSLGMKTDAPGLVAWDVFEDVMTPGHTNLLCTWKDEGAAKSFEGGVTLKE